MTVIVAPEALNKIDYELTLISPFHHGAGTSGNTALLRTHDVAQPDHTVASVPFLSAASIRHALRDQIAWHFVTTAGVEPGMLTKQQVDLLWSGGAVTSTGAETDLQLARRVEEVFPALNLFGYAAKSDIVAGTLRATDAILVCSENAWRLPGALRDDTKPAAAWRGEDFGTRHDVASSPVAQLIETADMLIAPKTTQMIFSTQTLIPGARLSGSLSVSHGATEMQLTAMKAAFALWAVDGKVQIGARNAQGYGQATIHGLPPAKESLAAWTAHVREWKDDILQLIKDMA